MHNAQSHCATVRVYKSGQYHITAPRSERDVAFLSLCHALSAFIANPGLCLAVVTLALDVSLVFIVGIIVLLRMAKVFGVLVVPRRLPNRPLLPLLLLLGHV